MALVDISKPSSDKQIKQITSQCLYVMQRAIKATYDLFWCSETPPQVIADALGTDAVEAFQAFTLIQEAVLHLNPEWVKLEAPVPFTLNPDGTVTIGK